MEIQNDKQKIIDLFMSNVKDKEIIYPKLHCGSEGHWLEDQMGIKRNSKNDPDIFGYEMKKESSKITFGDFSASEYLFSKNKSIIENINEWKTNEIMISRKDFIRYFGTPNPLKNNRYSWSGSCVPVYGKWNNCGQIMYFNDNLDLCISYSFEKDYREIKNTFPIFLKEKDIVIVIWKSDKLRNHINKKFNKNGFFICKKNNKNVYENICFGKPFDYEHFVDNIKNKNIIFDSGMYNRNSRNYSHFRSSSNNFWNKLITETF
jgi:hypothetical protein